MRLRVPTRAVDFWFKGVPDCHRKHDLDSGGIFGPWPHSGHLADLNATEQHGRSRCETAGITQVRGVRHLAAHGLRSADEIRRREPRISALAITNTPTFASVVIFGPPYIGSYEFFGRDSRRGVRLAVEELSYPRMRVAGELLFRVHGNEPAPVKHGNAIGDAGMRFPVRA